MDNDDKLAALEQLRVNPEQTKKLEELGRERGLAKLYFIKTYPPKIFFGARPTNFDPAQLDDICQKLLLLINIKDFNCQSIELTILTDPKQEIELLLVEISPLVNADGGNIEIKSIDEQTGKVTLHLEGACSGCPHSIYTLKLGIENALRSCLPWVKEVLTDDAPSTPDFKFPDLSSDQPDIGGSG